MGAQLLQVGVAQRGRSAIPFIWRLIAGDFIPLTVLYLFFRRFVEERPTQQIVYLIAVGGLRGTRIVPGHALQTTFPTYLPDRLVLEQVGQVHPLLLLNQ